MIPVASFRLKLLLAMVLVVAGVTLATLFISQRRVQASYDQLLRKQFDTQMQDFAKLRQARLAAAKSQCLKLARSVRLIARLTELGEEESDVADLYDIAREELRQLPREYSRFVNAKGRPLLPPQEEILSELPVELKRSLDEQLGRLNALPSLGGERQLVGYLAAKTAGQAATLLELLITPVVDHATSRTLGALAIGFRVLAGAAADIPEASEVLGSSRPNELLPSGILLDGQLYADPSAISSSMGTQVAGQIDRRFRPGGKLPDDFEANLNGVHYRVFYDALTSATAFLPAYQVCLYSLEPARRQQKELRWKILGSGAVASLGAVGLSWLLAVGLSVPIRELVAGTGEIQKGNYQIRVPVRSRDEIGQLAGSFNEMAAGLALKEKYRSVLSMVADKEVAQQLIEGSVALGGEAREVSVLFCDIRGFTALTQHMDPVVVIDLLNRHMTALTRVVYEYNGVVDKFVGDLIMAIFGAPKSYGEDVLHAAQCGLRMVEERARLNEVTQPAVSIGIGIATGEVVAGCMGSTDRLNYTVLGARVNLASRLCSKAKAGEVVIDQATRAYLEGLISVEPLAPLELKGWSEKVEAYRLCAIQSLAA